MKWKRALSHSISATTWGFTLILGASCCPPPPQECTTSEKPALFVKVEPGMDLPLFVSGWACGGNDIDASRLAQDYEVIIYVRTDKWYIQPFTSSFRQQLCENGYFEVSTHDGDVVHVFLAQKGLDIWPGQTTELPEVDGTRIVADWNSSPVNPQCSDTVDNDSDGLIDGNDPGCVDPTDDDESDDLVSQCSDTIDNDNDGLIDADDPGCLNGADDDESDDPVYQECSDNIDNDNDGLIDADDPGCTSATDDDESDDPVYQCSDGIDNDNDGLIDADDPGCTSATDDDESDDPVYQCSDGIDNDSDGFIDLADCDCRDATDDTELSAGSPDLSFLQGLSSGATWVDYSPTQYDPGNDLYPTEEQIGLDLDVLADAGFDGVLTYASVNTLAGIPRLAQERGIQLVGMGVWNPLDESEVARAIAERQYVTFYIIGSEGLFVTPPRYEKDKLIEVIDRIRRATCRPVTTAEPWDVMLNNADLFEAVDFLSVNIFPWWSGLHEPQAAVESLKTTYGLVRDSAGGKAVLVRETGFPTAGHPDASAAHQHCYFQLLSNTDVPFVHFEGFDQFVKHEFIDSYDIGTHWGLFDKDRKKKEPYPERIPSCWNSCPGCDGDSVLYTVKDLCYEVQYGETRIGLDCYKVGIKDRHYPITNCSFEYFEGHRGGIGDTLEMVGCGDAVYLQWAFARLQTITVRAGWAGSTDRGLQINDSLEAFRGLYPEARERVKGFCEPDVAAIWTAGHLKVSVNEQGLIDMIAVDLEDHGEEGEEESVGWFAPGAWP